MKPDKISLLPWKHVTDGNRMSAVVDADGKLVCGSLICQQPGTGAKERETHAFMVTMTHRYLEDFNRQLRPPG